jgi:hypothetical protein
VHLSAGLAFPHWITQAERLFCKGQADAALSRSKRRFSRDLQPVNHIALGRWIIALGMALLFTKGAGCWQIFAILFVNPSRRSGSFWQIFAIVQVIINCGMAHSEQTANLALAFAFLRKLHNNSTSVFYGIFSITA